MLATKHAAGVAVLSKDILHILNKFIYRNEIMMNNTRDKFNESL
jgi:hypothetical protein